MSETNMVLGDASVSSTDSTGSNDAIEAQFAKVLEQYQSNKNDDPFQIIHAFKSISAQRALSAASALGEDGAESGLRAKLDFENWDLETRLWNLVEILYTYRLSKQREDEECYPEYSFSSFHIQRENWLKKNPRIKELVLIIFWLQENSRSTSISDDDMETSGKWRNTRIAVTNSDLSALTGGANSSQNTELVNHLDSDAPLRSGRPIDPHDASIDSHNFSLLYKLVLANKIEQAIDLANSTGNYTLALILLGSKQDYIDPTVDRETISSGDKEDDMLVDITDLGDTLKSTGSGIKHKLLWFKTVYKLSQSPELDHNERLIYKFLSGNEIRGNLKAASSSWEEYLLLYLNQLFTYHLQQFIASNMPTLQQEQENLAFPTITPQYPNINGILNSLSSSDNEISEQSTHPIRVILGSLMIDQAPQFLTSSINTIANSQESLSHQPYLMRIITHLTIFLLLVDSDHPVMGKSITNIITLYISKLQQKGWNDLVPVYLSFIPDEKDSRECYALFLSSITDPEERTKQIKLVKKFIQNPQGYIAEPSTAIQSGDNDDKMANVFRRTVEKVMSETEAYYRPKDKIEVDADGEMTPMDQKACKAVEWFFESNMHEDAISASVVLIRRFLLTGKLSSLKTFFRGKNFKVLIKDFDADFHTQSLENSSSTSTVTDEMKEELLQYCSFVEGLQILSDWNSFLENTKINGSTQAYFWQSQDLEKSIEKVTNKINFLIVRWFSDLVKSANTPVDDKRVYTEFRTIYVPYLIIELVNIYQVARLRDWKYINKAFKLINDVADEKNNDYLQCFVECGRLKEFVQRAGELAIVASERGIDGIFHQTNEAW